MDNNDIFPKHPYWAAILLCMLCTLFTAFGSAIPQDEIPSLVILTVAVAISATVGILIMKKSRFSFAEFGFNKNIQRDASEVWFFIPLLIIEIIPIILFGITPTFYAVIALFAIAVGFNEEIFLEGLRSSLSAKKE